MLNKIFQKKLWDHNQIARFYVETYNLKSNDKSFKEKHENRIFKIAKFNRILKDEKDLI